MEESLGVLLDRVVVLLVVAGDGTWWSHIMLSSMKKISPFGAVLYCTVAPSMAYTCYRRY